MSFEKQFTGLVQFLSPYQGIWENEVMLCYPNVWEHYPLEWVEFLETLPEETLFLLEKKEYRGINLPSSLKKLYEEVSEFNSIPQKYSDLAGEQTHPYDHYSFLKIKPKKEHEIRVLAPIISKIYQTNKLDEVIDIGGGIGKLAQVLSNYFNLKVTSLDMDPLLQKTGLDRNKLNAKNPQNLVNYQNVKIQNGDFALTNIFSGNKLSVGLHTCGDLANSQFDLSIEGKTKSLVNLGCCYYRLSRTNRYNISQVSQSQKNLNLNMYALTLATRAHVKLDHWDYEYKSIVKNYRYTLHMYLYDVLGITEQVNCGNSVEKLYRSDFATYAREQLKRVNLTTKDSDESLNLYYHDPKRLKLVNQMILSAIIRGIFGRPLELYLLVDRCLYLKEHGYQVQLLELFDEVESPRNLAIIGNLI